MSRFVCAILCLFISTSPVFGQSQTTGSIAGSIQDQSGALIPGVEVIAEQEGTRLTRTVVSNESGSYSVPLLPPGRYTVTFQLSGFRKVVDRGVIVNATERVSLNVKLLVADLDTSIEVSAAAQLVQSETTTLGRVIDNRLTTALPLPTKNYTQLLALTTGTVAGVADTADLGRGSINITANGARHVANTFMLDGVDANNIHQNLGRNNGVGSNGAPIPSTEVIQEFKVQTGQYDAQYGRNAGASINVVTKSGTNEFRGVLYYYLRNDAFNANNYFFNATGTPRPVLRQNQWGGTVGGPIKRDKTFFFLGYQGTRQTNGASASRSTTALSLPPIPEVRTRQTLGAVFGGQPGRNGGVAVAADGSNINPVSLALLNARLDDGSYVIPSPQRAGSGVNYTKSINANYEEEQVTLSIDHNFNSKHKAALKGFAANTPQWVPFATGQVVPGFPLFQDFKNRNLSITYTTTLSPRLVNEARVGYNRPAGASIIANPVPAAAIGMNRPNPIRVPQIPQTTVSGVFGLGYDGSAYQQTIPNTFNYQDTLSWNKGSHFVRTGAEVRRYQTNLYNHSIRGSITFNSFPDFLLAMPGGPQGNGTQFSNLQSASVTSGNTYSYFRATDFGAFLQDDWKVTPKLTFNLGVRYDFYGFQSDKYGHAVNVDQRLWVAPPAGGEIPFPAFTMPRDTKYAIPGIKPVNNFLLDHNETLNFAPRIGIAYRPFGNRATVVRAGYGIFYERYSNQLILQVRAGAHLSYSRGGSGTQIVDRSFQNPFYPIPSIEELPLKEIPVIFGLPFDNNVRVPYSVGSIDPGLDVPYLQHYSLNVQHELGRNLLLEVGYVGSKGTNLVVSRGLNQPLLASPEQPINGVTTNTAANIDLRVPFLGIRANGFSQRESSTDSRYHSLQTSLTKRFSDGLQFLVAYTWAKNMDNHSGSSGQTLSSPSGDQASLAKNRGLSDFDRKHRLVVSYLYQIPAWGFGLNNTAFGRKFFAGWSVSGVTTLQSGVALTIDDSLGARLFGASSSRANYAVGATSQTATLSGDPQTRLDRWFDTSAFARAGDYWGDTGRGILRGPSQANTDVSIIKQVPIIEGKSLEWRMEVFNATNTPSFGNPVTNITSSNFGSISGTVGNARLIQFGLRFLY